MEEVKKVDVNGKNIRIGIIGTAGRKEDGPRMNKELYINMKAIAFKIIKSIEKDLSKVELVSGGAAWSDHLAVSLALENPEIRLVLCLPCEWDPLGSKFKDDGKVNPWKNPGGTSNYYHRLFSEKMGFDTLKDLRTEAH